MDSHPSTSPETETPPAPAENFKNAAADISEAELARVAGVAREDLKKLRVEKLTHGEHWTGGAGKQVVITKAGVARLQELLEAPEGADAGTGEKKALAGAVDAARAADRYHELIVIRVGNPRIVLARKKDAPTAEAPVRVQVRDSKNFRPGMEIHRCEQSNTPGVFYHHGRLPRSFGRY